MVETAVAVAFAPSAPVAIPVGTTPIFDAGSLVLVDPSDRCDAGTVTDVCANGYRVVRLGDGSEGLVHISRMCFDSDAMRDLTIDADAERYAFLDATAAYGFTFA